MSTVDAALVDIVREFLVAHQSLQKVFARYHAGLLSFEELALLAGDDEDSVLFRLKERCHSLFRANGARVALRREVLFDLAIGSLFHEAMSFRESFYQREIYGPRMRALRSEDEVGAESLFDEFERLMTTVDKRLREGVSETEALLDQTREQLRMLLVERRGSGYLARFLIENAALAEAVWGEDLDALLASIYGHTAEGYALAGRSYLASGYYPEARRSFAESLGHSGDAAQLEPLASYARGMDAYLAGHYPESVEALTVWVDAGAPSAITHERAVAQAALSRIGKLLQSEGDEPVIAAAASLLSRLP